MTAGSTESLSQVRGVWQKLGLKDPMWAVLSDPDKSGGRWDRDEFFRTGEQHVTSLIADMDRRGLVPGRDRCLDFGCGLGRLTQPLTDHFARADGVDVAESMIDQARDLNRRGDRCVFHVNEAPDLSRFETGSFDLVLSFIVLQHLPPELAGRYLSEFVRVTRPGGVIVFQLPSEPRPEEPAEPLPPAAFRATIEWVEPPPTVVAPGARLALLAQVTNASPIRWPARMAGPGPFHIRVGNHWRSRRGRMRVEDDARSPLPVDVLPGEAVTVRLNTTVPRWAGAHQLEVDVVQEEVAWFGERGSSTAVAAVRVSVTARGVAMLLVRRPLNWIRRVPVLRRLARGLLARVRAAEQAERDQRSIGDDELFDMNGVPRDEVSELLVREGAEVIDCVEDGCAGPHWVSYTYYARRSDPDATG